MLSIFIIFIVELIAFRWGTAKLASIGISADPHGHMDPNNATHAAHGPEGTTKTVLSSHGAYAGDELDPEKGRESSLNGQNLKGADTQVLSASHQSVVDSPATQIIGVMILEFGVLLHRCVNLPGSRDYTVC